MNNIVEAENKSESITQLAAQAALYSAAKRLFSIQLILGIPVIVIVAIAALALDKEWFGLPKRDISPYVSIVGLALVLLDTILINPLIGARRSAAAKIQQCFDSAVLRLPWNEIAYGSTPDPEDIEAWAEKNAKLVASGKFNDWYRVEVRELPHETAVLVCQRANCWWDMKLRKRYNIAVGIVGALLFSTLLGVSVWLDLSATSIFSFVVAPFLPFVAIARQSLKPSATLFPVE
ncbi:S-4TM family putative pore-forming effector, partial [Massilia brevitalea]|uniref:S-4TM family putative pore-forming effector n=1 Tax=Massilia brevitalea TaxID=442526 RepID=UPI0027381CE0